MPILPTFLHDARHFSPVSPSLVSLCVTFFVKRSMTHPVTSPRGGRNICTTREFGRKLLQRGAATFTMCPRTSADFTGGADKCRLPCGLIIVFGLWSTCTRSSTVVNIQAHYYFSISSTLHKGRLDCVYLKFKFKLFEHSGGGLRVVPLVDGPVEAYIILSVMG